MSQLLLALWEVRSLLVLDCSWDVLRNSKGGGLILLALLEVRSFLVLDFSWDV